MARAMIWSIAVMTSLVAISHSSAQQTDQAKRGPFVAKQVCAQCHAVEKGSRRSPDAAAPRFEAIANSPGMTATEISVALQTTPHRTMPNVRMNRDQLDDLVTYILSLKRTQRSRPEETDACFIVRDHNGQALACVYFEGEPGRLKQAKGPKARKLRSPSVVLLRYVLLAGSATHGVRTLSIVVPKRRTVCRILLAQLRALQAIAVPCVDVMLL